MRAVFIVCWSVFALSSAGCDDAVESDEIDGGVVDRGTSADKLHVTDQGTDDQGARESGVDATAQSGCAEAEPLTLVNGEISITASTSGLENEFGDQILCNYCAPLNGPQRYYTLTLENDTMYSFQLKPTFQAQLYLAQDPGCSPETINERCDGAMNARLVRGGRASAWPGNDQTIVFVPKESGTYLLVVDSIDPGEQGEFQLSITSKPSPYDPLTGECSGAGCGTPCQNSGPSPAVCVGAREVEFTGTTNTVTVDDDCYFKNQFEDTITCGTGETLNGVQRYFKIALTDGQQVTFSVTAGFNMGYLYIFGDTCDAAEINADCSSGGTTGAVSSELTAGEPGSLSFTPSQNGTFIFALDTSCPGEQGPFTIEITR